MENSEQYYLSKEEVLSNIHYALMNMIIYSSKYNLNVVTDIAVAGLNYDGAPETLVMLSSAYRNIKDKAKDDRQRFIVDMAFLMQADKLIPNDSITHDFFYKRELYPTTITYNNKTLMVFYGQKLWTDDKLTCGKSFLKNIRAILWPTYDVRNLTEQYKQFNYVNLFNGGSINVQVVYGFKMASGKNSLHGTLTEKCKTNNDDYAGVFYPTDEYSQHLFGFIYKDIQRFREHRPSVLVIPELAVTSSCANTIIKKLSEKQQYTQLAILGVADKVPENGKLSDENYNHANIVNMTATPKTSYYYKKRPSSATWDAIKTFTDDPDGMKPSDNAVVCEDVKGDERISLIFAKDCVLGVAICSDVVNFCDDSNPIHQYADFVDVLIVISANSADTEMFLASAETLARWYNCAVVYANDINCVPVYPSDNASVKKLVELSFAVAPNKSVSSTTASCGDVLYLQNIPSTTGYIKKHYFYELAKEAYSNSNEKQTFVAPDNPANSASVIYKIYI